MVWWASQFRFKQLLLQISLASPLRIYKTNQLSYYNFYSIRPESGRTPPRKHDFLVCRSAEPQGWYRGDTWDRIVPGCWFQRPWMSDPDPGRVSMRRTTASSNVQDSFVLSIVAQNCHRDTKTGSVYYRMSKTQSWVLHSLEAPKSHFIIWITLYDKHNNIWRWFHICAVSCPICVPYHAPLVR